MMLFFDGATFALLVTVVSALAIPVQRQQGIHLDSGLSQSAQLTPPSELVIIQQSDLLKASRPVVWRKRRLPAMARAP